jgi:hypothetical protein
LVGVQEIYGCYTIADIKTFLRSEINGIESDKPRMKLEFYREYSSKIEGEIILKFFKKVISK